MEKEDSVADKEKKQEPKKTGKQVTAKESTAKKTVASKSKTKAAPKKTVAPKVAPVPKKTAKATSVKAKKPARSGVEPNRSHRKVRVGQVVSNKMDKTAIVTVETQFSHKFYKKMIKKTKRFVVHDEENKTNIGDTVEIMETRPLSKLKRWRLLNIIEKSK